MAIGGGISGGYVGVGMVAPVTVVKEDVTAAIGNNTTAGDLTKVTATGGSVQVAAVNKLKSSLNIGSLGASLQGVGAGIGLGTSVLNTSTNALLGKNTQVVAGNDVIVKANSEEKAENVVVGVGGQLFAGVGVSGNSLVLNNTTSAELGGTVTAKDSILVEADDDSETRNYIVGVGAGAVGAAGAMDVAVINKEVTAKVSAGAELQANAQGHGLTTKTGEFVANGSFQGKDGYGTKDSYTNDTSEEGNDLTVNLDQTLSKAATSKFQGVAVTATARNDVRGVVVGGSAGLVGVSGSGAANIITNVTSATIGQGAQINQANQAAGVAQDVAVIAAADMKYAGMIGSAAVSGAGAGLSGDVVTINNTTKALIEQDAKVQAKKDLQVL